MFQYDFVIEFPVLVAEGLPSLWTWAEKKDLFALLKMVLFFTEEPFVISV